MMPVYLDHNTCTHTQTHTTRTRQLKISHMVLGFSATPLLLYEPLITISTAKCTFRVHIAGSFCRFPSSKRHKFLLTYLDDSDRRFPAPESGKYNFYKFSLLQSLSLLKILHNFIEMLDNCLPNNISNYRMRLFNNC